MKRIPPVIIPAIVLLFALPSPAVEMLYFADNGQNEILRCDLDGTNIELLVASGIENVGSLAIDRAGGKMYWTDWPSATAHIMRADLDGTNAEILVTGLDGPFGIALDVVGGKIYWTEFSTPRIRRAGLDGTGVEDLVTSGISRPAGIALDLAAGKMYWGDGATEYSAKIQRANLDGTMLETLVTDPLIAPQDIDLDLGGGKMYWSDLGTDSWFRADLDGSNLEEILLSVHGTPIGVAYEATVPKLYVSEYGATGSEIKRCNPDGTGIETLIGSGIGAVYGLTLGPDTVDCSDAMFAGPWLALVTGVEIYDYAVYMISDGLGTIIEMGGFNTPYPPGTYAVAPDCSMTGQIWSDGYVPFTGQILSETTAQMDIGLGPTDLIKVADPGSLEACWSGWLSQDTTGTVFEVTLQIDADGAVTGSTGFWGDVTGRVLTEQEHLAGHLIVSGASAPPDEIMFLDAAAVGGTVLTGTYGMDCPALPCYGGTFLLRHCDDTAVGGATPELATAAVWNYPNPFNPRTTIAFDLPGRNTVGLRVYDVTGRLVKVLLDGEVMDGGRQEVVWNGYDDAGRQVASGLYYCRLAVGAVDGMWRMVLIR